MTVQILAKANRIEDSKSFTAMHANFPNPNRIRTFTKMFNKFVPVSFGSLSALRRNDFVRSKASEKLLGNVLTTTVFNGTGVS